MYLTLHTQMKLIDQVLNLELDSAITVTAIAYNQAFNFSPVFFLDRLVGHPVVLASIGFFGRLVGFPNVFVLFRLSSQALIRLFCRFNAFLS